MIDPQTLTESLRKKLLSATASRELTLKFKSPDGSKNVEYKNKNILLDSFELKNSICDSNDFKLGGCIAGQMTVRLINIAENLKGWTVEASLEVSYYDYASRYPSNTLYPSDTLFPGYELKKLKPCKLFVGVVDSCLRQNDRRVKEIIAYDRLYQLNKLKCSKQLLSFINFYYRDHPKNYTLKDFINQMIDYATIDTNEIVNNLSSTTSFNDNTFLSFDSKLAESVIKDNLTIGELLSAYCELNAKFGIISRTGNLMSVLLFQSNGNGKIIKREVDERIEVYSNLKFEEYTTKPISLIEFPFNKDEKFRYGYSGDNSYYISDNIITSLCTDISTPGYDLGKAFYESEDKNYIFNSLYSYRPFSADVYDRWWLEPGDRIKIKTGFDTADGDVGEVDSFVFSRTIKGIVNMKVTIEAKGNEYIGKDSIETE